MNSYTFSDEAVQDLDDICNYIAQNNPNLASNWSLDYDGKERRVEK